MFVVVVLLQFPSSGFPSSLLLALCPPLFRLSPAVLICVSRLISQTIIQFLRFRLLYAVCPRVFLFILLIQWHFACLFSKVSYLVSILQQECSGATHVPIVLPLVFFLLFFFYFPVSLVYPRLSRHLL